MVTVLAIIVIIVAILASISLLSTARKLNKLYKKLEGEFFNDDGLNNDYIQSVLNILDSHNIESDLVRDNEGSQWISVKSKDGKRRLNILRLDEKNFGKGVEFETVERRLNKMLANEVEKFLSEDNTDNAEA